MIRAGDVVVFNHEKRHGWIVIHRTDPEFHREQILVHREHGLGYIPHIDVRLIRKDQATGKWLYICLRIDYALTVVGHDHNVTYQSIMLASGINNGNIIHWTGDPLRHRTLKQRAIHRKFETVSEGDKK